MRQRSKQNLQRRRKRILLLALVALALLVSPLFALSLGGPSGSPAPAKVTVHAGDTLWEIALRHGPRGADTRDVIRHIKEANHLDGALIHPGDTLLIPQG